MAEKMCNKPGVGHRYGKRHIPGVMNKTEERYAEILQGRKLIGEVIEWHFEATTFKLADGLRYTPDFSVFLADGTVEYIDSKGTGPIDDKSIAKIKMAAERFFFFTFCMDVEQTKKNGGGFKRRVF